MRWNSWTKRGVAAQAALLITCMALATIAPAGLVFAQSALALSGNFYRQEFQVPQGGKIDSPEVYVVVFNNGPQESAVRMTSQSPPGVKVSFSQPDFTLAASTQQRVLIGVTVSSDANPGDYKLTVSAESYRKGTTGIQIAGAAGQTANLKILGDSGSVTIQARSPEGQPLVATVRLSRVYAGQQQEISFSDTGVLQTKVAPGDFVATLHVGGEKLAEERFSLAAGGSKAVDLSAATVYFEGFGVVPAYETTSGKLAFLKVVYTVRNLYKQVDKAEVTLKVTRDGAAVEQVPLATLGPLDIGRAGLNYNYIPADGWVSGQYGFTLDLKLDGKPYAVSQGQTFNSDVQSKSPKIGTTNPAVFAGAGAAALVLAGGAFLLLRRKKKA